MNRNEQEYYANINGIARALDRIASALESNNKKDENITAVTPTGGTIYYKTRRDMYMDNPCTKEEYEAHKANNIPGFEGTLDALDGLCNVKKEQEELDTQHDYLHQLVRNLSIDAYREFCNEHCLPASDAVAVSNYITDLDYDEVLSIISDIEAESNDQANEDAVTYDDDYDLRCTAKLYTNELYDCNFNTKKECILDYVTNEFGSHGARYTDIIKFAYYLGAPNAPKFNNSNRGYYSLALTHGRYKTGYLVTGGKDQLVKGINKDGKERYFALSFVECATEYYKRLDQ
jgi:hypothetical protein